MESDSRKIGQALTGKLRGKVWFDEKTLARHATDQSMYQIRPLAVVLPQDLDDVLEVVRFARQEHIPLTPRAGGTNTAGSALGRGIVMVFSKAGPLNRIHSFDETDGEPLVTVEPGLLHDDLQRFLRERGLYLPADPSSGNICLLGGNIATKASGPHALKHGSIDRYLQSLQFVTLEGEIVDTADESTIPQRFRQGVGKLRETVLADDDAVCRLEGRKDRKLASGYNLFAFVRHQTVGNWVAQLLVGSVGTLGIVMGARLRAEPYLEGRATTLLYFRHLREAGDAVGHIKALDVAAIEVMNYRSLLIVTERYPDLLVPEDEAHMLLIEYEGAERHDQRAAVERFIRTSGYALAQPPITVEGAEEQARLWKARKALLPAVRSYRRDLKAPSLVNDVGMDPDYLADFIRDVETIFERHGLVAAIYGHAGSGNLHLRPLFDPAAPQLPQLMTRVADEVYEALFRYDGTITAEHGMGRVRAPYLTREWGETMVGYMRQVKELFDPDDLLNPEVIFSDRALTDDLNPIWK